MHRILCYRHQQSTNKDEKSLMTLLCQQEAHPLHRVSSAAPRGGQEG